MPTFPKKKKRPWIPTRKSSDSKGLANKSRSTDEYVSFYNSKQWRSLRSYYRQMNPLCEECDRAGYTVEGQCVDHIQPMRLGGSQTNLSNLQTLCNSCHAIKSGRESRI